MAKTYSLEPSGLTQCQLYSRLLNGHFLFGCLVQGLAMDDVLNKQLLNELRDLMGDDFTVLLDTYRSDTEQRLSSIRQAMASSNYSDIVSAAHSLKGSSANVGAVKMELLCHQMVVLARDADEKGLVELLPAVQLEYDLICQKFIGMEV